MLYAAILFGAGAFAMWALIVTIVPNIAAIRRALSSEPQPSRPDPRLDRWRRVHLSGDRGPLRPFSEPDKPFWKPEWELKKGQRR